MDIEFNKNEDVNKQLVADLKNRFKKVQEGGGAKNAAKQKEKGKMLARSEELQTSSIHNQILLKLALLLPIKCMKNTADAHLLV